MKGVIRAVSSIVQDKLYVCGGRADGGVYQSSCYALHGTSWEVQDSLSVARYGAAGSRWMGGWLVTGGYGGSSIHSSSDLYRGGVWTSGPTLPTATYRHCQVSTDNQVIVAG